MKINFRKTFLPRKTHTVPQAVSLRERKVSFFQVAPWLLVFALTACATPQQTATLTPIPTLTHPARTIDTSSPATLTPTINATVALSGTSTPTPAADPNAWMKLPVVPQTVSQRAREIYAAGQKLGNQPNVFTLVGDCDATPTWFLGDFDLGPKHYNLGSHTNLLNEIAYFQGSFGHQSLAVRRGFVAASVLTPLWADPKKCEKGETPLSCEIRITKPAFAFILLGTNDYNHREAFEPNMRKILDQLIEKGVLPILGTKADNMEKDYSLNASIARLAAEYELPLWNFWAATDPLPAHGLDPDLTHLTWASNDFSDPVKMQSAWPWRNLTALQTLEVVWNAVK